VKLPPHVQAEVDRMVAAATGMSEAGPSVAQVDTDVNGRPPRIPAIGLHPGAIGGSVPHRQRRLDMWTRRT
jgi:hypothetical protein